MPNSNVSRLQQTVRELSEPKTEKEKIKILARAFTEFDQEVEILQASHNELKKSYQQKIEELENSNHFLQVKLEEFDSITYYLNNILSNISQGLLFIDFSGGVTTCTPRAESILGVDSNNILYKHFWESFDDTAFGFSMKMVLATREAPEISEATFLRADGIKREFEIQTSLFLRKGEKTGTPVDVMQGLIVLIRDVTEVKTLQMIAQRNDRLKELGEMAALVAHEIRNPLGGIKGFASLLERDLKGMPELQQMASYIIQGTNHLNQQVAAILNYARPLMPEIEWFDLIILGKELIRHMKADESASKVEFLLEGPETLLAPIDPGLIRSALLNLLANAVQAMLEGGILTLSFHKDPTEVQISVNDTGIGILPEHISKLFMPFFTTKSDGNGFGLAEVQKIIKALAGVIEVKSEVGKGTTFTIKLPLKRKG